MAESLDMKGFQPFLYNENHSLGEWFKRSLMAKM